MNRKETDIQFQLWHKAGQADFHPGFVAHPLPNVIRTGQDFK
jgi:hypothetical protein